MNYYVNESDLLTAPKWLQTKTKHNVTEIQTTKNRLVNGIKLTGRQAGVFHSLSQLVQGSMVVNEAKKKRKAQAMITL